MLICFWELRFSLFLQLYFLFVIVVVLSVVVAAVLVVVVVVVVVVMELVFSRVALVANEAAV